MIANPTKAVEGNVMKHTPGPWEEVGGHIVRTQTGSNGNGGMSGGFMIADCGVIDPNRLANARLIAAAPELLEALKDARRWIGSLPDEVVGGSIMPAKLDEIIAKATT